MSKYPGRIVTDLAPAGYSVFFDGSGDFLSIAASSAFNFGAPSGNTNDFTIELWVYPTRSAFVDFELLYGTGGSGGQDQLNLYANGTAQYYDGTNNVISPVLRLNQWNHVAVVRNGASTNNLRVYANGVSGTAVTSTAALGSSVTSPRIGLRVDNFNPLQGYISNVRVVKGTALYTAAFTPPTQLFNITNTSLLTCNSPAIIDQSTNNFTITANGNAAVSTLTPFPAYVPYNPALGASTPGVWTLDEAMQAAATRQWNMYDPYFNLTTLLLHGNGTNGAQNNTFLDSSSNNFTITRNGNTTQGTFSPFSQTGWSNFFNGSSSIQSVSGASTALGSGNFCVDLWYYKTSTAAAGLFGNLASNSDLQWAIIISTTIRFQGWNTLFLSTSEPSINQWHHVAVCRSGTVLSMFIDGVRVATATNSTNFSDTPDIRVGGPNGVNNYTGYISNARVVKGSAVYDPNQLTITVPTTPLTNITNTTYLTSQSNRFVDNSTNNFAITVSGTPSVQAFSPFLPTRAYTPQTIGGSGYFDGTGDYLSNSSLSPSWSPVSSDFCIEGWGYWTSFDFGLYGAPIISFGAASGQLMIRANKTSGSTTSANYYSVSNGVFIPPAGFSAGVSGGTLHLNTWNHVALTRSGSTFRLFVNGALVNTQTDATAYGSTYNTVVIGADTSPSNGLTAGYITGVRVVTGSAVYTAAFTPATAPPTPISGTYILTNFTNAGVVDSTGDNVLETVGNAQISTTISRFGGSSMFFDGNGDYLLIPNSPLLNLSSGDWTIEAWVYQTVNTANAVIVQKDGVSGSTFFSWRLGCDSGGKFALSVGSGNSTAYAQTVSATSFANTTNVWYHIAGVKSGSTLTLYINGVSQASAAQTGTIVDGGKAALVGYETGQASSYFWNGYIEELRITRGIARYTGAFTPQTSQWQDQ